LVSCRWFGGWRRRHVKNWWIRWPSSAVEDLCASQRRCGAPGEGGGSTSSLVSCRWFGGWRRGDDEELVDPLALIGG